MVVLPRSTAAINGRPLIFLSVDESDVSGLVSSEAVSVRFSLLIVDGPEVKIFELSISNVTSVQPVGAASKSLSAVVWQESTSIVFRAFSSLLKCTFTVHLPQLPIPPQGKITRTPCLRRKSAIVSFLFSSESFTDLFISPVHRE